MNAKTAAIITIFILLLAFVTGCTIGVTCEQQCKSKFDECNERCGSGWLSGGCKDLCAISYNRRLQNCTKSD